MIYIIRNTERVIDLVLTDSLDSKLSLLDRKMKKMWIGKGKNNDSSSYIFNNNDNNNQGY